MVDQVRGRCGKHTFGVPPVPGALDAAARARRRAPAGAPGARSPAATGRGRCCTPGRSTRLAPLAIAHLAQMPVAYDGDARGPENGPALGRLHQLEVGPFRGFMRQETFDLSHDITLVYGANGTGKSSFCEALEVAMLGSISEAQAKRVDQRTYCNNARLRRHIAPVLSSTAAGEAQAVQPDEAEYRFCFIEKNRLDDFARIAARTERSAPAHRHPVRRGPVQRVRARLQPLARSGPDAAGVQAAQLAQRRLQLANSEQTIAAYPQKIAAVEGLEQALAQRMSPGATYQTCVDWLLGTPQQQDGYRMSRLSWTPTRLPFTR